MKPNILLITTDQLRWDYVGIYQKNKFMHTPNIDAIGENGCICTNAYSPNPVCIPARHNMITGLTDRYHGFDDNYFGKDAKPCPWNLPTFAQILSDNGYRTAAIGKMHFQPERRSTGFDIFLNCDEVIPDINLDEYAMDLRARGYTCGSYHGVRNALYMQPQESTLPEELHGSHWVADKTIEYLKNTRNNHKPFLVWTGFKEPHPPFDVPPRWAHKYDGKIPAHTSTITPLSKLAEENKCIADLPDEENINRMRELYACSIEFVDYNIGRIIATLKETNQYNNTLILFCSDHGEMLGDLDTYQKFLPYDASARIPLLLQWPEQIRKGTIKSEFTDLNDILPTMLDAAGTVYPADFDLPGESLLKNGTKNRNYQYIEHQHGSKRWCCIMDQYYKYVHYYGGEDQLFDRVHDPDEQVNLLYNHAAPELVKPLKKVLIAYEDKYGLPEYIENGNFKTFPPYVIQTYHEGCFPDQVVRIPGDKVTPLSEEILAAIQNEPTVKLSRLHIHDMLVTESHMSEEEYQAMMEKAKKMNRY